jgi:PAS domain S-box-containing protein
MATELRKTGISVVGDVPWGTHFCSFYETKQDLLDILIPFFKTGLKNNEFCLWIISNSELLTMQEARNALHEILPDLDRHIAEKSIELVGHDDWFLNGGSFDFRRVANRFKEKSDEALSRGYVGMRVNASPAWLETNNPKELRTFEAEVDQLYRHERIIASCTYPIGSSRADFLMDVARNHKFAIARRHGKWDVLETPALLQAKQQIEQLNRELEQRVRERTKELETANEKLGEEIKERKRAEEQARKVLDTIPTLIGSGTSNGILDYCNQQWLAYAGVSLEELQKDETLHPDDKARVVRAWQEAMATGKPYELEQRYRRFDGVYRWFLARGVPLKDAEGVIERWYGTLTDIEDRKQAEEALVESRRKLKEAQRLANIGYWERDLLADRLTFSKETAAIFGLSRRVFTQTEFQQMLHPDDRNRQELALKEALRGQRRYDNEYRIILPDGGTRFIHASDEIIYDAAGHPVRMFGAVQDVTERRRAEEAVRRSEEHLRLVIDTIPTMAWTVRPDGVVDFLNQRWLDYAGLSLEEYVNDPAGPIHPEDIPRVFKKWAADMATGEPYEDEMRLRRADGEYRWFLVRTEPLRDEQGNIVKWYGSSVDIEDRKQAEEALRKSERVLREAESLGHTGSWEHNLVTGEIFNTGENLRLFFGDDHSKGASFEDYTQATHPDDREFVMRRHAQLLAEGGPRDIEYRVVWPDGNVHVLFGRATVVRDELGQAIRTYGTNLDITERKHAEEQLKATSEQLRALSESLRKAKEEEGIRIARELHDELGSTLTSLKWSLLGLDQVKSSQGVSNENEKIAEMVGLVDSTINTVRRIASELRPGVLDDLGLVSAIEWHVHQFEHNTGIVCHFESNAEDVDLDREQATTVFRIFQEAMTNILRHAEATKVNILTEEEEEEGEFVLEVKDNGRGITEGEKLGTRSLGLLGMRERAHSLGGTVEISGVAGKGTVLTVRLPINTTSDSKAGTGSIEVTRTATSSQSRKEDL